MKRGELSMEVIIIAAIALLILVILSVLVIRAGGNLGDECRNVGGQCYESGGAPDGYIRSPNSCPGDQVCYVPLNDGSDDDFF